MRFAFNDEQNLIRDSAFALTRRVQPMSKVRTFASSGAPYSMELWQKLVAAGFTGTLVPEDFGGSGLGFVEAGCVLEALGNSLASVPYLGTAVLAVEIIKTLGDDAQRSKWLPAIADGQLIACVLGWPCPAKVAGGDAPTLAGKWAPVLTVPGVDLILVRTRDSTTGEEWVTAVSGDAGGLEIEPITMMDQTRRFAAVRLDKVESDETVRLSGALDEASTAWLQAVTAAGAAAEMLGGVTRAFDMAQTYAKERRQFGQPIGAFQSIKHMIADQSVALEGLRSAVWAALWTLQHRRTEAPIAAATAKTAADEVAVKVTAENIQIHGGMGFTADVDAHLYLKRAQLDRLVWGPPERHRETLERRLEELA